MPHNAVEHLLIARDGWLWIGTRDGLARFDGHTFSIYNEKKGFTDDAVTALAEDAAGDLWIGTKKGLYRRHGTRFTKFDEREGLLDAHVNDLAAAKDGSLWIAHERGLSRLHEGKVENFPYEVIHVFGDSTKIQHQIASVRIDSAGQVWAGSSDGLVRFSRSERSFQTVWRGSNHPATDFVRGIYEARDGSLWYGTDLELARKVGDRFVRWPFEARSGDQRVSSILQTSDGELSVAKGGVLWRVAIEPDGELNLRNLDSREPELAAVQHLFVTDMLEDRSGSLWVGTRYGGLFRFKPAVLSSLTTEHGLSHTMTQTVTPSREGGVWIGSAAGLQRLTTETLESVKIHADPITRLEANVLSAYESRSGSLWLATLAPGSEGLVRMETIGQRSQGQPVPLNGAARAFWEGRAGRLWIGTTEGLACYLAEASDPPNENENALWFYRENEALLHAGFLVHQLRSNHWSVRQAGDGSVLQASPVMEVPAPFRTAPLPVQTRLSHYDVRAVIESRNGDLWIGTWGGGVNRLSGGTRDVFSSTNGLCSEFVACLYEDTEGAVWAGTSKGISRIVEGATSPVDERLGFLSGGPVRQILEDDAGHFWIGGEHGLYCVRAEELRDVADGRKRGFSGVLFSEEDGMLLRDTQTSGHHAACKTSDGRLWFATAQGLIVVRPELMRPTRDEPRTFVHLLRANGRVLEISTGMETPETVLPAGTGNYLEVHFTAIDLHSPERLRFKYRLQGHDPAWINAEDRRAAYFTNLRPGRYKFEVIAGRDYRPWGDTGATLAFQIRPFYYETGWFRASGAAILGAGIILLFRIRMRALHERQRVEITKAFHDRLAGKLSAIVRTSNDPSPGGTREELATTVSQLAQTALRNLRQAIAVNERGSDTLDGLMTQLIQTAEELLLPLSISLRLDVPVEVPPRPVTPSFREHVVLFTSEALNNVVQHAQARAVHLRARFTARTLEIEIQDDGQGFSPQPSSRGLSHLRDHAAAVRGEFCVRSEPGHGTTVHLSVSLR